MLKKWILNIILISFSLHGFSQERMNAFGIQLKPIIPLELLGAGRQTKSQNNIEYINDPKLGMSFGMVIRMGFTKSLSLETGINMLRRNYDLTINDLDSNFTSQSSFRITNYEIPVLGLVYVQLNRNMYMNVAGGVSLDMYPTPLFTGNYDYTNSIGRTNWLQTSLLANVGWEYRTEKSGFWYFGASFHRPFKQIMTEVITYKANGRNEKVGFDLKGNYLTVDLRYFFHEEKREKKKKVKKKKGKRVFIDPRKTNKK